MSYTPYPHKIYPLNQDLTATWFVQFMVNNKPVKKYGSLNKLATVEERLKEANKIIGKFHREQRKLSELSNNIPYIIYPTTHDLTATWFVQFTVKNKPVKKYGSLNKLTTVEERMLEAKRIIREFNREQKALSNVSEKFNIEIKRVKEEFQKEKKLSNQPIIYTDNKKDLPLDKTDIILKLENALEKRKFNLRPNSQKSYELKLQTFLKWFRFIAKDFAFEDIAFSYFKYLREHEGLGNSTINLHRTVLKALFTDIKIDPNPFKEVSKLKHSPESYYYFDYHQQIELSKEIKENDPELWLACQFQYYLLLRPEEIRSIKCGAFNLRKKIVTVPGSISKNGKTLSVVIPDELLPALSFIDKAPPNYYVFGRMPGISAGLKPHGKKYLREKHQQFIKALNYNIEKYKFYSWKHTGAVMYYQATGDVKGLKEQGRWHSLDMVNEYLKNLGVLEIQRISKSFPSIGSLQVA